MESGQVNPVFEFEEESSRPTSVTFSGLTSPRTVADKPFTPLKKKSSLLSLWSNDSRDEKLKNLKKEIEIDEHKLPLATLFARLNTDPVNVCSTFPVKAYCFCQPFYLNCQTYFQISYNIHWRGLPISMQRKGYEETDPTAWNQWKVFLNGRNFWRKLLEVSICYFGSVLSYAWRLFLWIIARRRIHHTITYARFYINYSINAMYPIAFG